MSTVHFPRLTRHHAARRGRTVPGPDAARLGLALGGVAALVGLPATLAAVSLLLGG